MPPKKIITFTDFLKGPCRTAKDVDSREVLQLLRQAEAIPQKLLPFNGFIQVVDYTQRRHVCISGDVKSMTGYGVEILLEDGLDFAVSVFQKDDFKIYNETIFGQVTELLRKTPQEEHSDYLFTYSYRSRKADGKWMQLFQQGSYITDPKTKLPVYGIALVADISPVKKDDSMIFSIDKKRKDTPLLSYNNIITNYYHSDPGEALLSKREREILGRIADGLSSKQIADKLSLSENTVSNHRKSMLKKTNAKNVAELIRYASDKGII